MKSSRIWCFELISRPQLSFNFFQLIHFILSSFIFHLTSSFLWQECCGAYTPTRTLTWWCNMILRTLSVTFPSWELYFPPAQLFPCIIFKRPSVPFCISILLPTSYSSIPGWKNQSLPAQFLTQLRATYFYIEKTKQKDMEVQVLALSSFF